MAGQDQPLSPSASTQCSTKVAEQVQPRPQHSFSDSHTSWEQQLALEQAFSSNHFSSDQLHKDQPAAVHYRAQWKCYAKLPSHNQPFTSPQEFHFLLPHKAPSAQWIKSTIHRLTTEREINGAVQHKDGNFWPFAPEQLCSRNRFHKVSHSSHQKAQLVVRGHTQVWALQVAMHSQWARPLDARAAWLHGSWPQGLHLAHPTRTQWGYISIST